LEHSSISIGGRNALSGVSIRRSRSLRKRESSGGQSFYLLGYVSFPSTHYSLYLV
jgi:hypothetical protein